MVVKAPKRVMSLVRIKSRSYAGHSQFELSGIANNSEKLDTRAKLIRLFFRPKMLIPVIFYLFIQISARIHAKLFRSFEKGVWLRDESTR